MRFIMFKGLLFLVFVLVAPSVFAQAVVLDGVTAQFGFLVTALGTVGGLIVGAAAVALTFKWVKGMIFS